MTAELIAFVRARLDEDEDAADAALGPAVYGGGVITAAHEVTDMALSEGCDPDAVAHFERHDPARVLADVAALRALLTEVETWEHRADMDAFVFCPMSPETRRVFPDDWDEGGVRCWCGLDRRVRAVVGPFAAVHRGHPDYREEWAP